MNRDVLLGELKAFREHTDKQLNRLQRDVHLLMVFRWKVLGAATLVSAIASLVVQLVRQ